MAGYKVVTVKTMGNGDIDFEDLSAKVEKHSSQLAALMVSARLRCVLADLNGLLVFF
jgi:glycine cleavage system protein P-like pyridoxal-binding family